MAAGILASRLSRCPQEADCYRDISNDIKTLINTNLIKGKERYFFALFKPFLQNKFITTTYDDSFKVSLDGRYFMLYSRVNNSILLWDLANNSEPLAIPFSKDCQKISFGPDSSFILGVSEKLIKIWNINNLKEQPKEFELTDVDLNFTKVSLSPNSKYLVLRSEKMGQKDVIMYDVQANKFINIPKLPVASTNAMIVFDPLNRYVVIISSQRFVKFFKIEEDSLKLVFEYDLYCKDKRISSKITSEHTESSYQDPLDERYPSISCIIFSPTGRYALMLADSFNSCPYICTYMLWDISNCGVPKLIFRKKTPYLIEEAFVNDDGTYQISDLDREHPANFMLRSDKSEFFNLQNIGAILRKAEMEDQFKLELWSLRPIVENYSIAFISSIAKAFENQYNLDEFEQEFSSDIPGEVIEHVKKCLVINYMSVGEQVGNCLSQLKQWCVINNRDLWKQIHEKIDLPKPIGVLQLNDEYWLYPKHFLLYNQGITKSLNKNQMLSMLDEILKTPLDEPAKSYFKHLKYQINFSFAVESAHLNSPLKIDTYLQGIAIGQAFWQAFNGISQDNIYFRYNKILQAFKGFSVSIPELAKPTLDPQGRIKVSFHEIRQFGFGLKAQLQALDFNHLMLKVPEVIKNMVSQLYIEMTYVALTLSSIFFPEDAIQVCDEFENNLDSILTLD